MGDSAENKTIRFDSVQLTPCCLMTMNMIELIYEAGNLTVAMLVLYRFIYSIVLRIFLPSDRN